MKIEGYHLQDGCWNCKHQHEDVELFNLALACNFKQDKPAVSFHQSAQKGREAEAIYEKWMEDNTVDDVGICSRHEKNDYNS